jgi:hypothetical protein
VLWLIRAADCGAEFFVKLQLHQRAEIRVDQLAGDFGLEPYEWALPVKFSESVVLAAEERALQPTVNSQYSESAQIFSSSSIGMKLEDGRLGSGSSSPQTRR